MVRTPAGEVIASFHSSVRSIEDGAVLARFRGPRPLDLRPGEAEFHIEPAAESLWQPFHARAKVPEHGGTILLTAVERGAGLRFELHAEGAVRNPFRVEILDSPQPESARQLRVRGDIAVTEVAWHPGAYRVRIHCHPLEPQDLVVQLETGKWTESSVYLRAKPPR